MSSDDERRLRSLPVTTSRAPGPCPPPAPAPRQGAALMRVERERAALNRLVEGQLRSGLISPAEAVRASARVDETMQARGCPARLSSRPPAGSGIRDPRLDPSGGFPLTRPARGRNPR